MDVNTKWIRMQLSIQLVLWHEIILGCALPKLHSMCSRTGLAVHESMITSQFTAQQNSKFQYIMGSYIG